MHTRIQVSDFSVDEEIKLCADGRTDIGGIAVFCGTVRDNARGKQVVKMELAHYGGMAEKQLARLRGEAIRRFGILNMTIVHRVGELKPGDQIVCMVCAGAHRKEAFDACAFAMEELKKTVPIWKKEFSADGESWADTL